MFESVLAIVPLPNGRLAVADRGLLEVRVYDHTGALLAQMGRRGSGPGEFQSIFGLWVTSNGDLGVWDAETQRITTFTTGGRLVASERLTDGPQVANVQVFLGTASGDRILLGGLANGSQRRAELAPNPWVLLRYHLSGAFDRQLGHVRGMWRLNFNPAPFTPVPWVAVAQDTLFVSDGFEPIVDVRDTVGRSVRQLSIGTSGEVTRAHWKALEDSLAARADGSPFAGVLLRMVREGTMPFDSRAPAIGGLLADGPDLLWVKRYDPRRDMVWLRDLPTIPGPGGTWLVSRKSDGAVLAEVETPDAFALLAVGPDRLIGVVTDAWGVQRVVAYRLRRAGGGS